MCKILERGLLLSQNHIGLAGRSLYPSPDTTSYRVVPVKGRKWKPYDVKISISSGCWQRYRSTAGITGSKAQSAIHKNSVVLNDCSHRSCTLMCRNSACNYHGSWLKEKFMWRQHWELPDAVGWDIGNFSNYHRTVSYNRTASLILILSRSCAVFPRFRIQHLEERTRKCSYLVKTNLFGNRWTQTPRSTKIKLVSSLVDL